jgi:inositol 1,4,5-triphosphate receptor type 1
VCFICGIDRATFDRDGVSFPHHIRKEHDLWAYVNLLVHLRTKPRTEFNGWESHIAAKLAANDLEFFPMHRALSLRLVTEKDEADKQKQKDLIEKCAKHLDTLSSQSSGCHNMLAVTIFWLSSKGDLTSARAVCTGS